MRRALPEADIHYAVKADPAAEIPRALAALGSSFDAASPDEIDRIMPPKLLAVATACVFASTDSIRFHGVWRSVMLSADLGNAI